MTEEEQNDIGPALDSLKEIADGHAENENGVWKPEKMRRLLKELALKNPDPIDKPYALKQIAEESGWRLGDVERAFKAFSDATLPSLAVAQPQRITDEQLSTLYNDVHKKKAEEWKQCSNLIPVFHKIVDKLDVVLDFKATAMALLIIGLSLIGKDRIVIVWGSTGDGKTFFAELILKFLDVLGVLDKVDKTFDTSPEYIKYAGDPDGTALQYKVWFLDEMNPAKTDKDDRRQELLRQIDNDDSPVVVFRIVDRTAAGGLQVRPLLLKKPFIVLATSITSPQRWDAQLQSRALFPEIVLSPEQIEEIQKRISEPTMTDEQRLDEFKAFNLFVHGLRRQDKALPNSFYAVEVPFMKQLVKKSSDASGLDIRRFKLLKALIEASAILHQNHRVVKKDEQGRLILVAAKEDYLHVKDVVVRLLPRISHPAGQRYINTFKKIAYWLYMEPEKTKLEIQQHCHIPLRTLESDLPDLEGVQLIASSVNSGRYKSYRIGYKIFDLFKEPVANLPGLFPG